MSEVEDKTLCALQEEGYIEYNMEDFMKLIHSETKRQIVSQRW